MTEALRNLDNEDLTSVVLMLGSQGLEMYIISESGLYKLIFRANKPEAKSFKRWVPREVLPTIRKTGRVYLSQEKAQ